LDETAFVNQVMRQQSACGYCLAFATGAATTKSPQVLGCAGFRITEFMAWGRTLYVDDLVTDEAHRGRGVGGVLLDWLVAEARSAGCAQLHLDSGVQRFRAHRFYLTHGMDITAHHFRLEL
jgi:GNAT superfamily N-acetyltransferase